MNILQVSTFDIGGGADRVAWGLFQAYRERGHESTLVVGTKKSNDSGVKAIPRRRSRSGLWNRALWSLHGRIAPLEPRLPGVRGLRSVLRLAAGGLAQWTQEFGREDFCYPESRRLTQIAKCRPDVVHAHNLHGGYFDLRFLVELSTQFPVVLTMHDEWLLTGHCAYTLGCNRWRSGCGKCPDLTIYPALSRDGTAANWRQKQGIYRRSHLNVATPSHWLMKRVEASMPNVESARIIPYGVDHSVFRPSDRVAARQVLGLPVDKNVLLFVAANDAERNMFKDYSAVQQAVNIVKSRLGAAGQAHVHFVVLGAKEARQQVEGGMVTSYLPFQPDVSVLAQYYQSADLFLHAARADNFPNTVLEAQACGLPVIATAVGGIGEQIIDGKTGYLVSVGDSKAMAQRIIDLLQASCLREAMGEHAAHRSRQCFSMNRQVDAYLGWYEEVMAERELI